MSFYTALTGLNAATAQMGVTSNNIANVSTTGFKRSRTDFGDIFATSPLQKASATIGQGVALKKVTQEFGQGNLVFSSNTLDLAISGDGFFPLKSQDGFQDIFTRNGVFMMNDQYNVVNSAGQKLMAASVDSSGKANLDDMNVLTIPQKTTGMATQTSKVQLGLNFPADASVISKSFNRNDPTTYNKSTALTVYDAGGNSYLASVYYVKTQNASQETPNNKWQTYVYVGDKLVNASLQQATNNTGDVMYVNKYGELKAKADFKTPAEIAELNSSFSKKTVKFSLDALTDIRTSQPATVAAGLATSLGTGSNDGVDFSTYTNMNKTELLMNQGSSGVTYNLNTPALNDGITMTFGPSTARVTVSVDPDGVKAPTALDIATALNSNPSFAASYVAQAPTSSVISNVKFASAPLTASVNDFKSFSMTLNGKTISFDNIAPTSTSLSDLAATLQARLRNEDRGNTDLSVTVVDTSLTSTPALALKVTDAAGRAVGAVALQTGGSTATGAPSGGLPSYPKPTLKITALDPNVSADTIEKEILLKQGTASISYDATGTAVVSGTGLSAVKNDTSYPRSVASYAMGSGPFKATFHAQPTDITVAGDTTDASLSAFVTKLNANESFAANYSAQVNGTSMVITAKDPTVSSPTTITSDLQIYNTTGTPAGFNLIANPATGTALITTNASSNLTLGTAPNTTVFNQANGAPVSFAGKHSIDDLKNLFTVNIDSSVDGVTVGLDRLIESMKNVPAANQKLSGTQIAAELTNEIQRAYGDEKPFNFSTVGTPTFSLQLTLASNKSTLDKLHIDLSTKGDLKPEDLVREVQKQVNDDATYKGKITVSYDTQAQKLVFTPTGSNKVSVTSDQSAIGLTDPLVQGVNDESVGLAMSPSVSTSPFRALNDQRYGMKVEYDAVKQSFVFKSGSTGDTSSIAISNIRPGSLATQGVKGLGMTGDPASYTVAASTVDALRGIASKPAVLTGNALAINVDNNFSVDATNNQFVVSVNGITGTVTVPPKDTYTLGTFMEALQNGINNLQSDDKNGLTPQSVNGVKVSYNAATNALEFTTGTASTDSYIKVTGDAKWGLDGLDAKFGTTTTWIKPKAFTDEKGATVYIDGFGAETSSATGFDTLPSWSPVYFDKGELTFDTAGNLVSPKQGAQLDTVYLPNGKGALTININYSKSTQFASPFSVLSQSQDGAPEGDLVGLAIKDDGLVQASYSNGAQKSLAKVVLVNFSNSSGLRQIGDTNYYKTSDSGTPKYGEAGSAGFGTVRSGATERANVDLTQELVDLITEQRNFQANAKAMETSTSMTNTIIQIRN
ncbi:flagellar hook-basal body complex protein [Limnohabitans sp.]|uniref:flagellar hook-basal body complex protein n=1 Tax=Limnohabitans sp. TaxID=1907725 RepID=UPI00286EDC86|nr:flagellar hook-basal body complex protein [Limnohabitans sp.]